MSLLLVTVPTLCYLGVAINEARLGNYPQAAIFGGYTLANCGFLWGMAK